MSASAGLADELAGIEADVNVSSQKVGASVWRLGPGGMLLSSVIEDHAGELAASDRQAIYFYADLEGSSELKHDHDTMQKVHDALAGEGWTEKQIVSAVNAMQNAGIYFREANF